MRFPSHTTPEDILDLCGPGVYRVYALDALGEQLADEHIARWDLTSSSARDIRNAPSLDSMLALRPERAAMSAGPATDLRFALETMAQMMRTNSDALRLVAESQVDLAKTIATVKGLPRNGAMYLPPTTPITAANDETDDDQDDDEDDIEPQQAAPTNYLDLLMPFSEALAGKVADMVPAGLFGMGTAAASTAAAGSVETSNPAASSSDEDIANRPFEAREIIDLQYAKRKGDAKRAAGQQSQRNAQLQARVVKDPQVVRQIMAIKSILRPEEIEILLPAVSSWSDEAQTKFLATIKPLSVDDAIVYCREVIKTVIAHQTGATVEEGGNVIESD